MQTSAAKFTSFIFHPALIPTYVFALVLFVLPSGIPYTTYQKGLILAMIHVGTFVLPALSIYVFYKLKAISALDIPQREQRPIPFVFISFFYLSITYFLGTQAAVSQLIALPMLAVTMVVLGITLLSFLVKVSVHTAGISGGAGILLYFAYAFPSDSAFYCFLLAVLAIGIVGTARLQLQAHSLSEVLMGAGVGLFITLFVVFY